MAASSEGADGPRTRLLKEDLLGRVERVDSSDGSWVRRDPSAAPRPLRPLARHLVRRELRALDRLAGLEGFPAPARLDPRGRLWRPWLPGRPLQEGGAGDPDFHARLLRRVAAMHHRSVTHDDLAKEPNVLVLDDGAPALVDFQLARVHRRRGAWFRLLAREDLRHVLKHKRTWCPTALTPRERALLARPSWAARLWRWTGKRLYLFVTRRLLGWADREGAGDRGAARS